MTENYLEEILPARAHTGERIAVAATADRDRAN
jgi:hypothetical protein